MGASSRKSFPVNPPCNYALWLYPNIKIGLKYRGVARMTYQAAVTACIIMGVRLRGNLNSEEANNQA